MRYTRSWLSLVAFLGVLSLAGCIHLPEARPLAIDEARSDFAVIDHYLDADAKKTPRSRFVEFVKDGGFHIDWLLLGMSKEELKAVRWNGAPAVVDASEDSTTGTVIVAQRRTAYTGGGWMGNNYTVSVCWSFTVDLEKHSVEGLHDVDCPEKIEWMLAGVDEKISIKELQK